MTASTYQQTPPPDPTATAFDPDQRYLVLGLGATGLSVIRFLSAAGAQVAVADSREKPPGLKTLREQFPDVAVFTGEFPDDIAELADCVVVSPGISVREKAIAQAKHAGREILGDIELFARVVSKPVIGITGTNGKSTVTTLMGEMAREAGMRVAVGGNLGEPALAILDDANTDLYVLELSSFQLETTWSLKPIAATVLNLSRDHMDRYDDYDEYVAAKASLLTNADTRIGNRDDLAAMALGCDLTFGRTEPDAGHWGIKTEDGDLWLCRGDEPLLPATAMKVPGMHNLVNALAAMALADVVRLPREAMVRAVQNFKGLEHRTEWVGEFDGVTWFNDSKGTNVGATIAAIQGMPGTLVLILGGDGKGADFAPLADVISTNVRGIIYFGRDANQIKQLISSDIPSRSATTLRETVESARDLAQPGDSILFSPACASFDLFDNYAQRGELFKQAVFEVCT